MSEKTTKRNPLLLILCIVLAVAVILSVVLFNQRAHLASQVDQLTADLSVSRTNWETTSTEKETLQAELTTAQNDLREAQTSLEESNTKIEQLDAQITTLNGEIEQTKLALGTATDLNTELNAQITTLQNEKAALETTVQDLNTQISDLNTQIATLKEELATANSQVDTLSTQLDDATASTEEVAPAEDAVPAAEVEPAESIAATVNGQVVTQSEVDGIAQNMLNTYAQYGYDTTNASLISSINQYALEYAVQLEVMEQKAVELGLDQLTDEEKAAIETQTSTEWEDLISTYITYYVTLAEDATDDEKAAARETAITGLEELGYTYDLLLSDYTRSAIFDKVYAEMIKDAIVTDEDVLAAFNTQVEADQASYAGNVATYEYMTQYYGQTSYYQPEGYRGITHILLEVEQDLLTNYQTLVSTLASQDPTATDTDLVTQDDVDAAYAAIIASVQPTIDEINQKLADGVSFDDLIAEYGKDPGMQSEPNKSEGYAVHADSIIWDPAFVKAAFSVENVGDIAEPVVGNYGVHIVKYHRDVPAGAVELTDDIRASLQATLQSEKEDEVFNAIMTEWMDAAVIEYPTAVATPTDAE